MLWETTGFIIIVRFVSRTEIKRINHSETLRIIIVFIVKSILRAPAGDRP